MSLVSEGLYEKTGQLWRTISAPMPIPVVGNEKYEELRRSINPYFQARQFRINTRPTFFKKKFFFQNMTLDDLTALYYAAGLACAREVGEIFDLAILYEDFMSDKRGTVRRLFVAMGVEEGVDPEVGLRALEVRST